MREFAFGSEAVSADNAILVGIRRVTTGSPSGGTAVTPQPLDSADAAAVFDATQNPTTDPTISANYLLVRAMNQKSTLQWQARPGGELISPATDNNGFAIMTPTTPLVAMTANLHIEE